MGRKRTLGLAADLLLEDARIFAIFDGNLPPFAELIRERERAQLSLVGEMALAA
jgi:hypothetical protein